ncbi:MAG TPA: hypothetical protein VFU63_11610 [Ktedonobacterales bacterium]|nr:hypothetical protein [Ktedonobacterales bacterium]
MGRHLRPPLARQQTSGQGDEWPAAWGILATMFKAEPARPIV